MKKIFLSLLVALIYFSFLSFVLAYNNDKSFSFTKRKTLPIYNSNGSSERVKTLNAISTFSDNKSSKSAKTASTSNNKPNRNQSQNSSNSSNATANLQFRGGGNGFSWALNLGPFNLSGQGCTVTANFSSQ